MLEVVNSKFQFLKMIISIIPSTIFYRTLVSSERETTNYLENNSCLNTAFVSLHWSLATSSKTS